MKKLALFILEAIGEWFHRRWEDYKVNFNRNGFALLTFLFVGFNSISQITDYREICSEYQIDIIDHFQNYFIEEEDTTPLYSYRNKLDDNLFLRFSKTNDNVNGELTYMGVSYTLIGTYVGEGQWFAALFKWSKFKGIVYWTMEFDCCFMTPMINGTYNDTNPIGLCEY